MTGFLSDYRVSAPPIQAQSQTRLLDHTTIRTLSLARSQLTVRPVMTSLAAAPHKQGISAFRRRRQRCAYSIASSLSLACSLASSLTLGLLIVALRPRTLFVSVSKPFNQSVVHQSGAWSIASQRGKETCSEAQGNNEKQDIAYT